MPRRKGSAAFPGAFPKVAIVLCFATLAFAAQGKSQTTDSDSVRLLVYNLRNYAVAVDEGAPSPKEEALRQRQAEVIASAHPQLVGLMEVGCASALQDLQDRLRALECVLPHSVLVEADDPERRLALLSKFPLRNLSRTDLRFLLDQSPQSPARGLLWAAIEVATGVEWHVVGLHWKSRRETPTAEAGLLRLGEARVMRQALDEAFANNPALPMIVWGDCNESRADPAFAALRGPRETPGALFPLDLADAQGDRWTHYWKETDVYSRIDFVLLSKALRSAFLAQESAILRPSDWFSLSDHRPLLVTLRLPE